MPINSKDCNLNCMTHRYVRMVINEVMWKNKKCDIFGDKLTYQEVNIIFFSFTDILIYRRDA